MIKSYRIQVACPHMDHAEWMVVETLPLSLAGVSNTYWEFDCPVHGPQRAKPLQAEEKLERVLETTKCNVAGCANNAIGVLNRHPFCRNHFIVTCQLQLEAYRQWWKERRWREASLESVSRFIYSAMREAARIEQKEKDLDAVQRASLLKIIFSAADLGCHLRRSPRKTMAIPLRLLSEQPQSAWQEQTETVMVSRCGALVRSEHFVEIDQQLRVIRNDDGRHAPARVAWRPHEGDTRRVLALEFLECDNFWRLDWRAVEAET